MNEEWDDPVVDHLLESRPFAGSNNEIRAQLKAKTSAMVGRRRRVRQASLALLMMAAFGAGWSTRTWFPSTQSIQIAGQPAEAPLPTSDEALEQADGVIDLSDFIARRSAAAKDVDSYVYWRNSGNHQLLVRNDLVAALRAYRRALDAATAAELRIADQNDTWLLSELKSDRQQNLPQENPHAHESLEVRHSPAGAIALLLTAGVLAPIATAQQPVAGAQAKSPARQPLSELPLEELLERALSRNPAIRKAQVELTEAQVSLDRARQEVARDVTAARMALEMQRLQIEVAHSRLDDAKPSENAQSIEGRSKFTEAKAAYRLEVAKLSELESRLQYITGEPATSRDDQAGPTTGATLNLIPSDKVQTQNKDRIDPYTDPSTAGMREKLLAAADKIVDIDFVEMPLADAIDYLSDLINIRFVVHQPVNWEAGEDPFSTPITLKLEKVPFSAGFAALQDQAPRLKFVVRPYGVLLSAERWEPLQSITVEQLYRSQKRTPTSADAK